MESQPDKIISKQIIGYTTFDSLSSELYIEDPEIFALADIDEAYFVDDKIVSNSQLDLLNRLDEIDEIGICCEKIIEQIESEIKAGDIGVVIGDDISGRLPTLIISRVISKLCQNSGEQSPKTIFIAGDNTIKEYEIKLKAEMIQEQIYSIEIPVSKKALLVTDTMLSGDTIKPIIIALDRLAINYTIATIGLVGSEQALKSLYRNIIYATICTPEIYFDPDKNHLAGVSKKIGSGKIHSNYDGIKRELAVEARGMAKKQVNKIIRGL